MFHSRSDKTKQIVWRRNLSNLPSDIFVYTPNVAAYRTGAVRVAAFGSGGVRGIPSEHHFLVFYDGEGEVIKDYTFDEVLTQSVTGMLPHTARLHPWFWDNVAIDANVLRSNMAYAPPLKFDLRTGTALNCAGHRNPGLSLSVQFHALPVSVSDAAFNVTLTNISKQTIPVHELDLDTLSADFYDGQGQELHLRDVEDPAANPGEAYRSLLPGASLTKSFRWADVVRRNPENGIRFGFRVSYFSVPIPAHPAGGGCAEAAPIRLEYKDGKIGKFGRDLWDAQTMLNQELAAAVTEYDVPAVKALLAQHADPNTVSQPHERVYTPFDLEIAGWWEHVPLLLLAVRPQLDTGVNVPFLPFETNERTCTDLVRALLDGGTDPNKSNAAGTTPLIEAARQSHRSSVLLLLNRGTAVEARNDRGQSALMVAHGDPVIYNALIEHKADLNVTDKTGNTPLMYAAENGDARMVATLLRRGAPVNVRNRLGETALWYGARTPEVVRVLLSYRAQLDTHGGRGAEVLFNADNPASLKLLIDAGVDVNVRNEDGQTVLMDAVLRDPRAVKFLVTHGAEIDATTTGKFEMGYTALMRAVKVDEYKAACILVAHHADVNVRAADGETALSLAVKPNRYAGPTEMAAFVRLLKKVGARE